MKKLFYFLFLMPLFLLACEGGEVANEGNNGNENETETPGNTEQETPGDEENTEKEPEEVLNWGIVGSMNNWDEKNAIEMTLEDGYYAAKSLSLEVSDVFLFVKGDYVESYGGNGRQLQADYYYPAVSQGSNIRVKEAGVYDVYLNEALTHFYIMTEGKNPAEAEDADKQVVVDWYVGVDYRTYKMHKNGDYLVAQDVALGTEGRFTLYNSNGVQYGAEGAGDINVPIVVAEGVEGVVVKSDPMKVYDIFYREADNRVWAVENGDKVNEEIVWDSVEGTYFSSTNFMIAFVSQKLKFYFDVNSGVAARDGIIPEGRYHVKHSDSDGGYYFNLEEWAINDCGTKTYLYDGYMDIAHISGGYDIVINVTSILLVDYNVHYRGPVSEIPLMGNPIKNPQ